jgi:hypothetical protein
MIMTSASLSTGTPRLWILCSYDALSGLHPWPCVISKRESIRDSLRSTRQPRLMDTQRPCRQEVRICKSRYVARTINNMTESRISTRAAAGPVGEMATDETDIVEGIALLLLERRPSHAHCSGLPLASDDVIVVRIVLEHVSATPRAKLTILTTSRPESRPCNR